MIKFRPLKNNSKYRLKARRNGDRNNYNFVSRYSYICAGWKLNHKTIGTIFYKLHYLACHAPNPIKAKFKQPYLNLRKKMLGAQYMSVRYANRYSCYSWL